MGNKIADAAKRVRQAMYDDRTARGLDVWLLASEWLAEHPEDDKAPVDAEWLAEVGFLATGIGAGRRFMITTSEISLQWWACDDEWLLCNVFGDGLLIPTPATRGDVRRICKCLGITIGGPQ